MERFLASQVMAYPTGIVLLWMIVPARDTRKHTLQQYMLVGSES
jgi:hypothetical protein